MGAFKRLIIYLKEARQEAKKVDWPTSREVFQNTIMVLVFSGLVTGLLGGFDLLFNRAFLTFFSTQRAAESVNVSDLGLPDLDIDGNNEPIGIEVTQGEEEGE